MRDQPVRLGRTPVEPPTACRSCAGPVYKAHEVMDITVYLEVVPAPRGGYFWFERHRCEGFRHDPSD